MVNSKVTGKGDPWIVTEKLIVNGMEKDRQALQVSNI